MTKIDDRHHRWRNDADYKGAYDALGEEFVSHVRDRRQNDGASLAAAA